MLFSLLAMSKREQLIALDRKENPLPNHCLCSLSGKGYRCQRRCLVVVQFEYSDSNPLPDKVVSVVKGSARWVTY